MRTLNQVSDALRYLRKKHRWSQEEFGRKLGLSQERISAIERNPQSVNLSQLLSVLARLDAELVIRIRRKTPSTAEEGGLEW